MTTLQHDYVTIPVTNEVVCWGCLQCFDAVGWAAGRASGLEKTEWWGTGIVIWLERGADLHMAQLMPLPLTVSSFSKIQTVLPFWYWLTWVVPDKGPLNRCVRVFFAEDVMMWITEYVLLFADNVIYCILSVERMRASRRLLADCTYCFTVPSHSQLLQMIVKFVLHKKYHSLYI